MSVLSDIEIRRIKDETTRDIFRRLMLNASDPERIGKRVLAMDYQLKRKAEGETLKSFARRIKVSEPRACVAVANAEAELFEIRKVNPAGSGANSL